MTASSRSGRARISTQALDRVEQLDEFLEDLVLLEAGQPMQPQVEDRLRLHFRQAVHAAMEPELLRKPVRADRDRTGALEHLRHRPAPQLRATSAGVRLGRVRRRLDQRDHLVDVRERDGQPLEDVAALARLAQLEDRAARDDLAPVAQEGFDQVLERQQLRLPVLQRHHVDAEHGLHRRLLVEVVEHDVGDFAALQLDDDAHAVLVGLVAQLRDALDQLAAHQLGDALEQPRLVDLVRQLGDDDRLVATVVDVLDVRAGAHQDAAATGASRRCRSRARR